MVQTVKESSVYCSVKLIGKKPPKTCPFIPWSKVLPDWRPAVQVQICSEGEVHSHVQPVVRRLEAFMSSHTSAQSDAVEQSRIVEEPQKTRKANASFMMALDHMLHAGLGRGLLSFVARQGCKALGENEIRYWVESTPGQRRACVKDRETGQKRYELPVCVGPDGKMQRPSLHVISDEGSIGRVCLLYLMGRTNLRGTCWQDPLHRHWNDTKLACQHCMLWPVIQEYTCVFNVHMAPWNQSAFHSVISKAGAEYCAKFTEQNELFIHLYEDLVADAGCSSMLAEPSDCMAEVWTRLRSSPHLHKEGDHVKLGRWYSFFREAESRAPHLAELELFLLYVGIQQQWWQSYDSSPLGMDGCQRGGSEVEEMERRDPEVGAATSSRSVLMSNERESLKALRGVCRNTMEVVLHILKDRHKKRLLRVLMLGVGPYKKYFSELQSETKTSWGRLNTIVEMAHGTDLALICYRGLSSVADPNIVAEMRLNRCAQGLTEAEVLDDRVVAEHYFNLVVQMAGQHFCSAMHYTHSWPGRMALLVSESAELQALCRRDLRVMWEWLMDMESKAVGDPERRGFLDDLQFPQWQWVREICMDLWEHNFEVTTPFVREALLDCFSGMFSTNIVEDSFNRLKRLASQAPNKKLRRQRRYHGLQASGLQDEYGAPQPSNPPMNMSASTLPSNLFEPNTQTFTLEESGLQDFMKSSWVAPSPQRYGLVPMALQCCLHHSDWEEVRKSWMTLLLEEGCVAVNSGNATQAMLVLKVSKWGAILWPLKQIDGGGNLHFAVESPCTSNPLPWRVAFVSNLEDWKAARVKVLPPAAQSDLDGSGMGCIRLDWMQSLFDCLPLQLIAASRACREDTNRKPTTEHDLCRVCLAHLLAHHTEQQLTEIMARRFKPKETHSVLFDEKNLEMVGPVLDEADHHDFDEARKAHSKRLGKASGASQSKAFGGASGSTVAGAPRSRDYLSHRRAHSRRGQKIEDVLRRSSPFSYSKSYGDESVVSKTQALRMVLAKAWERHKGFTGETCPFSFDAVATASV
eukprot:6468332-Amphidinium_carterae.2